MSELREQAKYNSCKEYLNVSVTGLRRQHHPAISGLITAEDVKLSRSHIKMLSGDFFTYQKKSNQSGGSPHCRVCGDPSENETIFHILITCSAYIELRRKVIQQFENICTTNQMFFDFQHIKSSSKEMCQFLLDPTSLNLKYRINPSDPNVNSYFQLSRRYCNSINTSRLNILMLKRKNQNI